MSQGPAQPEGRQPQNAVAPPVTQRTPAAPWSPPPGGGPYRPRTAGRDRSGAKTRHWLVAAVARGLALFFGLFTLINLIGALHTPAFDENVWWVDLRFLPHPLALVLLGAVGVALVAYAVAPRMRAWRRWPTLALCLAFAAATAWNTVRFYLDWRSGDFRPGVPFPLSVLICAAFVFVAWAAARAPAPGRRRITAAAVIVAVAVALVVVFPLAQFAFFGTTDYRRPADVVVVFGAQVHNNGNPSTSLSDRMNTAIELYKAHLVQAHLRERRRGRQRLQRGAGDARHGGQGRRAGGAHRRRLQRREHQRDGERHGAVLRRQGLAAHPRGEPVLPPAAHQAGLRTRGLGRA